MPTEQQKRILIVDDDDDIRTMIRTALVQRDLMVDQARNGSEALAMMHGNRYAVVILDLLMPEMDGFGVLDALQESEFPSYPVVLVVTAADRGTIDKLDPRRIHGIVRKPFDPVELASVVVACADVRGRGTFEAMAVATMIGGKLIALF